jgi:pimeloyl-ACP methyl ester carboxylesterase
VRSLLVTETERIDFDGHRLAYRVAGDGPALVVLNGYRRRADMPQLRFLSETWRVFQIDPIGYGYSDRVPGYAGEALTEQVLAVLDRHAVDRFVIWGYSQRGGMAACVARATPRAAAMVAGGISLLHVMTAAEQRRGDRVLHADHPSRAFWRWFMGFDWASELAGMRCPRLVYFGGDDLGVQGRRLRQSRDRLEACGVDVVELEGLDHQTCSDGEQDAMCARVIPAVVDWIGRQVGSVW